MLEFYSQFINKGDLCFDVGANLGKRTDAFLKLEATVVAIDPQNVCLQQLREKYLNNSNVIIVDKALGAEEGEAEMMLCESHAFSTLSREWIGGNKVSGRFPGCNWDRSTIVLLTTLDRLIEQYGKPTFCKIDVEGFELQVLKGLSQPIKYISFEFAQEFIHSTINCIMHLASLGEVRFNYSYGESMQLVLPEWVRSEEMCDILMSMPDIASNPELSWGDIYADFTGIAKGTQAPSPIRLHLGCGEQHFEGYVNIDYPPSEHNVMDVNSAADVFADITELNFPNESIDEIRLHHVFEHFNRVSALALLIRWHSWLKIGGVLRISTPDLVGSARTILSDTTFKTKMGAVRHLAGDQAAPWGYHIDHWFPERFERTLRSLGFSPVQTYPSSRPVEPYLSDIEVIAIKSINRSLQDQLQAADELLWDSTVSPAEEKTHRIWKQQLRNILNGSKAEPPKNTKNINLPDTVPLRKSVLDFSGIDSSIPLVEIHNFNQRSRDAWVRAKAATIPAGSKVLGVGAGTCPYRDFFNHCHYVTHDFGQYEGIKLGGTTEYGKIGIVSPLENIPVPDDSFDVVLCTEVLEHVPEPIEAIREIARILKPNGKLLLTSPLGSGLYQLPYHFYGGYTPEWYKRFLEEFDIEVSEITPNGGFFKHLAQECARASWILHERALVQEERAQDILKLFNDTLPRFLCGLDDKCFIEDFTVGYHVEGTKKSKKLGKVPSCDRNNRNKTVGLIFSKDRAMQLDAALQSFLLHCKDSQAIDLKVIYKASSTSHERSYQQLMGDYGSVEFVKETNFKSDILMSLKPYQYILFAVDDNIFIRDFSVVDIVKSLENNDDALGFSLRLGKNTAYCYPLDTVQKVPNYISIDSRTIKYNWTQAEYDFGYPLELSSSIYRVKDILPILVQLDFSNPNALEGGINANKHLLDGQRNYLLCCELSAAFCNPINITQNVSNNRAGTNTSYSIESLAKMFEEGYRIDVESYSEFIPSACHQELDLRFRMVNRKCAGLNGASQ